MKISIAGSHKWPLSTAALVSDTNNLQLHMKELVRAYGWKMDDPTAPADIALSYLQNGSSFLLICEDTAQSPAYESIRTLINHPAGRLTPILVLLLENSIQDALIYQKVLHVGVTKKPLTPNLFSPAFQQHVKLWKHPFS